MLNLHKDVILLLNINHHGMSYVTFLKIKTTFKIVKLLSSFASYSGMSSKKVMLILQLLLGL